MVQELLIPAPALLPAVYNPNAYLLANASENTTCLTPIGLYPNVFVVAELSPAAALASGSIKRPKYKLVIATPDVNVVVISTNF